ncbi:MAG: SET domain-containing protein [Parachlamydiales bacterium]|jgi:hypothetical protein
MIEKYTFKIKKENIVFSYTKKQLEDLLEIEYLTSLKFESAKICSNVQKLCLNAARNGYLNKENVWFGCFYEKEISTHFVPDVYIKWIDPIKEYGLFANSDLPNRAYLGEYTGVIKKYNRLIDNKNSYLFEYHIGYKKSPYTIDAREKGSIIRFVNHSSKPNIVPLSVYLDGAMHLIFRTNRKIKKDEELTYDYGPNYWKKREKPIGD